MLARVGATAALAVPLLAGCASGHHSATGPTTTLLQRDTWTAPAVSGPASAQNFCAVLTAMYRHESELPLATTRVKEAILGDFVASVPEAISEAPASIAAPARTYLTSVASILSALEQAGLDYQKIKPGTLTAPLLDPSIKAAGNQVLSYSEAQCHYAIGGA